MREERKSTPMDTAKKVILVGMTAALLTIVSFGNCLAGPSGNLVMGAQKDFKSAAEGKLLIFDTFITFDEAGNYVPELAESWTYSKDGKTLTLALQKGVKYHNGEPFNAASAKYTLQRSMTRAVWAPFVESIEALDDYTLKIVFNTYYEPFLRDLASGWTSEDYVCPTAVDPQWDPKGKIVDYIGTGPFKLAEYKKDQQAVLVRNENYWDKKPKIQKLFWKYTPDPYAQLLALKAGELDIVGEPEHHSSIPFMKISELKSNPDLIVKTHSYGRIQVLEFNCQRPPFDNPKVREALNLAIDREKMVRSLFGDVTRPSDLITDPKFVTGPHNINQGYPYEPEKAKALLAETGWVDTNKNGILDRDGQEFEVELIVPTGEANADMISLVVQSQLRQVGVRMKISTLSNTSKKRTQGEYDLYLHHSGCLPSVPGGIGIGGKYHSKGWPYSYHSPELDALIEAAFTTTDPQLRRTKCDEIWALLHMVHPCIPLYDIVKAAVMDKKVTGFTHGPTMFDMALTNIEVKP
jgi:peptide/nickel transport system substrate-binding protein